MGYYNKREGKEDLKGKRKKVKVREESVSVEPHLSKIAL
jgi:hypothetical protein